MSDNSSSSTMIVALVAIVVIVALGFLLYKQFPAGNTPAGTNIDVNLPTGSAAGNSTY